MRITSLLAVLFGFVFMLPHAAATTAVRVELAGVVEAPGKMTATVGALGPDGRAVPDLSPNAFSASIGGKPLVIKEAVPAGATGINASILVVSDASKAMTAANLTQSRGALTDFTNGLQPGDKVGVVAFNTSMTNLIDITPERPLVTQAVNRLGGAGDADLYAAVSDATRRMANVTPERRMVVLLSAGKPVASPDKRAASLTAAGNSGVMFYPIALGDDADRDYLNELAATTGGRMLDAPNANALRPVLTDLASTIRGQYALIMEVPVAVDRTLAGRLQVGVNIAGEAGSVQRALAPLPGAVAPIFAMKLNGVAPGQKVSSTAPVTPSVAADIQLAKVEYVIDGNAPIAVTAAPFSLPLDTAQLAQGNHILKVTATDAQGRHADVQVPFVVAPPPAPGKSLPIVPFLALLALAGLGYIGFKVYRQRMAGVPDYSRARVWSNRLTPPVRVRPAEATAAEEPEPPDDRLQGRLLVIDERPDKRGEPGAIREFEMRGSPLSLGVGAGCAIRVEDPSGEIANEEARIWVQKRRLVYHKLTTLSAMATEGMVSGWLFLEDGDEMRLGSYRLLFRAEEDEALDTGTSEAAHNFANPGNLGSPAA